MEIWKNIKGYEGLYQVSNYGNVKSLEYNNTSEERERKLIKHRSGYLVLSLSKEGKTKSYRVHRLVAEAFLDNPNNYPIINHKDEDKTNNKVDNLEWCTYSYNNTYGTVVERRVKNNINHTKKSKKVLCVETGVVYPSTHQVERELGYNRGNISSACRGEFKTIYGYHWEYV